MVIEAQAVMGSGSRAVAHSTKRPVWRRFAALAIVIAVLAGMIVDTKVVRVGSSEDLRQAGFSAETFGAQTFPKIQAAIAQRAVEGATLAAAIAANKDDAVAKFAIAGGSGPVFSVKLTGEAGSNPSSGIYDIKAPNLPAEIRVRVQTGPAINGTELRDATGTIQFGQFTNQIEYQNAGSALNNEMKKLVLAPIAGGALSGKTVSLIGAFRLVNPKSWLITPVQLEIK